MEESEKQYHEKQCKKYGIHVPEILKTSVEMPSRVKRTLKSQLRSVGVIHKAIVEAGFGNDFNKSMAHECDARQKFILEEKFPKPPAQVMML